MALEPAVLEGALALLLGSGADNDVVQFHDATELDLARRYDAAIVTIELLDDVRADVVITLPDTVAGSGMGHVTTATVDRDVALHSTQQVIDLLDEQFPTGVSRPARLAAEG